MSRRCSQRYELFWAIFGGNCFEKNCIGSHKITSSGGRETHFHMKFSNFIQKLKQGNQLLFVFFFSNEVIHDLLKWNRGITISMKSIDKQLIARFISPLL